MLKNTNITFILFILLIFSPVELSFIITKSRKILVGTRCRNAWSGKRNEGSRELVTPVLTMVVDPSYNLTIGLDLAAVALASATIILKKFNKPCRNVFASLFVVCGFLSYYVADKTNSVRFSLDKSSFSVVKKDGSSVGLNPVVGGDYSWKYTDIVNWLFLPNTDTPLFLYFKEIETPKERIVPAPIIIDDLPGQVHYFPVIGDWRQLDEGLKSHMVKSTDPNMIRVEGDLGRFIRGLQLI